MVSKQAVRPTEDDQSRYAPQHEHQDSQEAKRVGRHGVTAETDGLHRETQHSKSGMRSQTAMIMSLTLTRIPELPVQ